MLPLSNTACCCHTLTDPRRSDPKRRVFQVVIKVFLSTKWELKTALVCRTGAHRTHALRVTARRAERQTAKTNPLKYAGREHLYLSPSTPPPPPSSVGSRRWDQREEQRRWAERKATESRVRTPQRRQPGSISRLPNVCEKQPRFVENSRPNWSTVLLPDRQRESVQSVLEPEPCPSSMKFRLFSERKL